MIEEMVCELEELIGTMMLPETGPVWPRLDTLIGVSVLDAAFWLLISDKVLMV